MKIKIEIEESLEEDEVLIRRSSLTDETAAIQRAVIEATGTTQKFVFYKGSTEYYLTLNEILFFETDGGGISAHTNTDVYQIKELFKNYTNWKIFHQFFCGYQSPRF